MGIAGLVLLMAMKDDLLVFMLMPEAKLKKAKIHLILFRLCSSLCTNPDVSSANSSMHMDSLSFMDRAFREFCSIFHLMSHNIASATIAYRMGANVHPWRTDLLKPIF